MDPEDQVSYLREVHPFLAAGRIDSIRISTRPDALSEEVLSLLQEHGVRTVEIGVQSMIDDVLLLSNRGHSAADAVSAISRLKQRNFEVGAQLMIGLPGDSIERFLRTLDLLVPLRPDFLRIHPTLVLRGAPLETLWRSGQYVPLSLDEAVQWLKRGLLALEKASVPVARIGLQPSRELEDHLVAGPYHPSLSQLVRSAIALDMASHLLHLCWEKTSRPLFLSPQGDVHGPGPAEWQHFESSGTGSASTTFPSAPGRMCQGSVLSSKPPTENIQCIEGSSMTAHTENSTLSIPRFVSILAMVFLVLFSAACATKRQVVTDRRSPPPEKKETRIEIKEEKPTFERVEKRETRVVQYGVASWYGPDFHGKPTSSGEVYDMYQLTCAHNTFALGTMVMVTHLENGRSVELRVNDRGPFVKERIIDLSYAAARILGMWEKGTAQVKVEGLGPLIEPNQPFTLQVGSFTDEANAQQLAAQLRQRFENVYVATVETSTQKYHRVRIGQYDTKDQALAMAEKLSGAGFKVLVTNR